MPKLSLMPWEQEFVRCPGRFLTIMGGRGGGKSHAIQARIKWLVTRYPRFRYLYVTPLSVQGDEVFNEMVADPDFRRFIKGKPRARPYPKIKLKNGSQVWFRSCRLWNSLRSTGEDEITLDESQDERVTERDVQNVLMPMIGRRRSPAGGRGVFVMAGQFRGTSEWRFENYWVQGQPQIFENTGLAEMNGKENPKSRRPLYWSWRIPSSMGYAYCTPGGKEELALRKTQTRPEVWDQEWEAIPTANANAVFSADAIDAISSKRNPLIKREENPREGGSYVVAVDIGGIQDQEKYTVTHSTGAVVLAGAFPLGRDAEPNARESMEVARRFRALVVIDTTGETARDGAKDNRVEKHRYWADKFRLDFKTFTFQGLNKERLVENARLAVQDKIIAIYAEREGIDVCNELKTYEYVYKPKMKTYAYQGPNGRKDDYVQCVCMTVEALNRGWFPVEGQLYRGAL